MEATETDELDASMRAKRMRVALHHVHLPKLAAAGVLDYQPGQKVIELTADIEGILNVLELGGSETPVS